MSPQLTDAAKAEILRLHGQRDRGAPTSAPILAGQSGLGPSASGPEAQVRAWLSIEPGGCAQQRYQINFEGPPEAEDHFMDNGEVELVVRAIAWPHVQQLTLDYSEDLMGGSFRFDNPALSQTCNCGQSFSWPQQPNQN
ncbi:MAG: iron-sulfur cluster assembly accessory protein [Synechococcales cyanobacterium RM1_1_8]|nr:iron-sulfur cluster assembly accessory protein [Synechococcales cyanobacterium RM1_1_8]